MEIKRYKELDYILREPSQTNNDGEKYPLVIYLHGAGGRGRDLSLLTNHSFLYHSEKHLTGAFSVMPQCYADSWFDIFEQLQDFIEFIISDDRIDATRVYLVGASMGGYGTWQMAMSRPELFAAIVPICGGGMYWNSGRLLNMGVWAFHGDSDPTVSCEESKKMVDGIKIRGGKRARLTIFENTPHNAWTPTFQSEEMWKWLLEQRNLYTETKNEHNDVEKYG